MRRFSKTLKKMVLIVPMVLGGITFGTSNSNANQSIEESIISGEDTWECNLFYFRNGETAVQCGGNGTKCKTVDNCKDCW
jgi:hypothetical protein